VVEAALERKVKDLQIINQGLHETDKISVALKENMYA